MPQIHRNLSPIIPINSIGRNYLYWNVSYFVVITQLFGQFHLSSTRHQVLFSVARMIRQKTKNHSTLHITSHRPLPQITRNWPLCSMDAICDELHTLDSSQLHSFGFLLANLSKRKRWYCAANCPSLSLRKWMWINLINGRVYRRTKPLWWRLLAMNVRTLLRFDCWPCWMIVRCQCWLWFVCIIYIVWLWWRETTTKKKNEQKMMPSQSNWGGDLMPLAVPLRLSPSPMTADEN